MTSADRVPIKRDMCAGLSDRCDARAWVAGAGREGEGAVFGLTELYWIYSTPSFLGAV